MKFIKAILPFFVLLVFISAHSQQHEKVLNLWQKQNPIEKVYLHLDRKDYFAGQTSWFKGYFVSEFLPSAHNSTLFAELVNGQGHVVAKKVLPVFGAITYGQIDLPDTLTTGTYRLRAYTPLMLNHNKAYVYSTAIRVYGRTAKDKNAAITPATSLLFFPEGGTLLAGVENNIAFKATSDKGLPVNVSAAIKDRSGTTVAQITSTHDGMGSFTFSPAAGNAYTATLNGATFPLPEVASSGLAVRVRSSANNISSLSWSATGGDRFAPAYIVGQMQHKVIFKQPLDRQPASEQINTASLHSGILQLTFFNRDGMPLAERLVFINNKEYRVPATLATTAFSPKARAKNTFTINFEAPVEGNFSVAVTDDYFNEPGPRSDNIISALLLTSDIPGYIHNPSFYFTANSRSEEALDLVMLTNGWRRFNWKEIIAKAPPPPSYTDPGYISLSGQVQERGSKKNFADRDLLVWVATSDSGRALQMLKTDSEGKFKMDSVVFFDKAKILFSDVMGNKSKFITVKLNSDSLYKTYNLPAPQFPQSKNTPAALINNMQSAYSSYTRGTGVLLDNVNIEGKRLTLEELEKKYVSGMFRGNINARTINLTGQFIPQMNIFEWLTGRVPSLNIQRNNQFFDDYRLSFRQQPVQLFLDEMQMQDANLISTIPPNQIALIKIYPQFIGARGNGAAVAIYTKRGDDLNDEMENSGDIVDYDGYSIIKEFYSPDYAVPADVDYKDYRLTLQWKPEIAVSSGTTRIPITFYNTDRAKKFKIIAEGITKDGKLLMLEKTVE